MEIFNHHVRDVDSCHTNARIQIECFLDQRHSVINIIQENCREMEVIYRVRVTTMFNTTHFFGGKDCLFVDTMSQLVLGIE